MKKKARHTSAFVLMIVMALLFTYLSGSVSFTVAPSITPPIPYTDNNLTCSWTPSTDMNQTNVSWYKNDVLFISETTSENQSKIYHENTTKNEEWICNVTISNGTAIISSTATTTIINSAPEEPNVFNSSGSDIGAFEVIYEDQIYNYNISSSDDDNDTLTYRVSPTSSFCSISDESTGETVCAPTTSNLGGGNTIGQKNITFWADDTDINYPKSTGHTVLFNITPVNDNPQFSPALQNQTKDEGEYLSYAISGTDEESNYPLNFTLNVTPSLNLAIINTSNTSAVIVYQNNDTLPNDASGSYTVNVTLRDSDGGSVSSTFVLSINNTNQDPVLRDMPQHQNGTQGEAFLFYVYADDVDVNDSLSFIIQPLNCPISNPWSITTINSSHNATAVVNVTSLTNDQVICGNGYVNITVFNIGDAGAEDSQDVFLNISNTNDPPNVEILSSYLNNTNGNNITALVTYAESAFIYLVNATDIDNRTYEGEVLSFSDNSTIFDINSSTGLIMFTPGQGQVDNYTINITVTDQGGLSDYELMYLEIRNNAAPVLTSIGSLSCAEDSLCSLVIDATDFDNEDLTFESNNSDIFSLSDNLSANPVVSAYLNYTPDQSMVGNYSILITVTDIRGATDSEAIFFAVNNTNDAPVLQSISFPTIIVETHPVSLYVQASDDDYDLPGGYEYVTFGATNVSGKNLINITTYLNSSNNKTYAIVSFTPQEGDDGNYTVNITATDYYNGTDYEIKSFNVLNQSDPPNITQIKPYGRPFSMQTIFNFINTRSDESLTSIDFSENRTVIYDLVVDNEAGETLSYAWYINGSENSTSTSLNLFYDYFASGMYNITVVVSDDMYESSSYTWNLTVSNDNRNPLLLHQLENLTGDWAVNGSSATYADYFLKTEGNVHFIDPDDDLDSDDEINNGESSNLSYTSTSCDVATLTMTGDDLKVTPDTVGTCLVNFTAQDSDGLTVSSELVLINVSDLPENGTEEVPVPQTSSGGGGSGRSKTVMVPMMKDEVKPQAIELIVPQLVTIYENRTVLIPVTLKNNWNSSLYGIKLNATTNATDVKLSFTESEFEEIGVGESKGVTLIVDNYRLGENYEIKLTANVTDPLTSDSALVLLNTIEQAESSEDVQTKVTFAQDLMNENPECLELNELLMKAKAELEKGYAKEASRMVDGVINGCKYLVSISKKKEQRPETVVTKLLRKENRKYLYIFLAIAGMIIITALIIRKTRSGGGKEEAKAKPKEEEIKPYVS